MRLRLLSVLLLCVACTRGDKSVTAVAAGPRYLALGDSYTIGEAVDPAQRWPVQLVAALRAAGDTLGDPEIIARTGWTTDDLSAAIDRAKPTGPYALVSLLIGVNDEFRGHGVAAYEAPFRALLQRSIGFAGGDPHHVIVLSIPDWGATPYARQLNRAAIGAEIDAFNAVARRVCEERGVHFVDITPESREALGDAGLIAYDGLHPSARMYAAWTALALPAARAAIKGL